MTTRAYKDYLHCLEQLDDGRAQGTLSREQEEALEAEMEELWVQLTDKEVRMLGERIAAESEALFEDPC